MKKFLLSALILALMIFSFNANVSAKTLGDLKKELAQMEKERDEANAKQELTKQEMATIDARITSITGLIAASENKIKELNAEIVVLEEKSAEKTDEIKDVVSFLQVTDSNNAYLEYIFGAQSITDLIFRTAISEQLVEYNNDLIEEYNETVKEHNAKKEELNTEIENLDAEQDNLKAELVKLGDSFDDIVEITVNIDEEIVSQKKAIDYYEKTLGCSDDQDINSCGNIPYSGSLVRPVVSGRITSNFGWRKNPVGSGSEFHNGIDISGGNTAVYAAGPGTVAGFTERYHCGGNMLYIHHNVNGVYYTTSYFHLAKVYVKVGDYVDQNTQIGVMGGNPKVTWWDQCTTGTHLHFSVARGLYLKDYSKWNTYISKQVNPTTLVNFPGKGVWFSNRITKY